MLFVRQKRQEIPRRVWEKVVVIFLERRRKAFPTEGVSETKAWKCELCLGNNTF